MYFCFLAHRSTTDDPTTAAIDALPVTSDTGTNGALIVGIILAVLLVIGLIVLAIFVFIR